MGVERVDYSSDDEYRQAQQMEEWQEQKWQEEQYAKEMEARMIAEEQEKESVPLDPLVSGQNLQKDALTMNEMRQQPFETDKKWEPLCYVNATPDDNYVLRILEAHLSNCETGRWQGNNEKLINEMNKWQDDRAELLRKAIAKLRE